MYDFTKDIRHLDNLLQKGVLIGKVSNPFEFRYSDKNTSVLVTVSTPLGETYMLLLSYFPDDKVMAYQWFEHNSSYFTGPVRSGPSENEALSYEIPLNDDFHDDIFSLAKDLNKDINTLDDITERNNFNGYEEKSMKTIKIKEEMRIPGTDIILEEGDKIEVMSEKALNEASDFRKALSMLSDSLSEWEFDRNNSIAIAEMIAQYFGGVTNVAFLRVLIQKLKYEIEVQQR